MHEQQIGDKPLKARSGPGQWMLTQTKMHAPDTGPVHAHKLDFKAHCFDCCHRRSAAEHVQAIAADLMIHAVDRIVDPFLWSYYRSPVSFINL